MCKLKYPPFLLSVLNFMEMIVIFSNFLRDIITLETSAHIVQFTKSH